VGWGGVRWDEIINGNLEREGRRIVGLSFFFPSFLKEFFSWMGCSPKRIVTKYEGTKKQNAKHVYIE